MKTNYHKDMKKHIGYAISWMTGPLWHIIHHYKTKNIIVQPDTFSIATLAKVSRANDLFLQDKVHNKDYKLLLHQFKQDKEFFKDFLHQLT